MPPVIQLFLCVYFCAIALTCSFRSSFFRFSPQRQGSKAPTESEKRNSFAQRWGKTAASNVRFPIALSTMKDMVNKVDFANAFSPHFGLNKSSRRRLWSLDEIARLRELVKGYEGKVPPTRKATMWREIGAKLDRTPGSCERCMDHVTEKPPTYEKKVRKKWTKSEVGALQEQVKLLKESNHFRMGEVWQKVSHSLNHSAHSCETTYRNSKLEMNKTSSLSRHWAENEVVDVEFTPEQDALIQQRVEDWGDKGLNRALYTKISEELGGVPVSAVRKRYFALRIKHKNPVVRFRSTEVRNMTTVSTWNATLDARLSEAVHELGSNNHWKEVAERMNCSVTWSVCRGRWKTHVHSVANYPNTSLPWTEQEFARLGQLVSERSGAMKSASQKGKTKAWTEIGEKLGRLPGKCARKWREGHTHKTGRYTPEEDALILQRVEEWGDKGVGLWQVLDKELNRANVRGRWLALKTRRIEPLYWTDEMDEALLALVHVVPARQGRWIIVAERMQQQGWRCTAQQCISRYNNSLMSSRLHLHTVWTQEMIKELMSLRKNGTSWKEIGEELNVAPRVCGIHWKRERDKLLKHGPFTAEEDARIRKEVDGRSLKDLPYRFWSSLREDMGRPADELRRRWVLTLHFKDV